MPCNKSSLECILYITHVLEVIESIERRERTNLDYIDRNVLNWSWLYQTLFSRVNVQDVLALIGSSIESAAIFSIRNLIHNGFAAIPRRNTLSDFRSFVLCDEMYDAITSQLESPKIYGNMHKPRQILGGRSAIELLELLIQPNNTELVSIISDTINLAFGNNINVMRISEIPELNSIRLDSSLSEMTRIISYQDLWYFSLIAYPSNRALDGMTVRHIKAHLHDIRVTLWEKNKGKYGAIQALLVTPAIDDENEIQALGPVTHINYIWAFSVIRLIYELEKMNYDYNERLDDVASQFIRIFDPQDSQAFSVQEASKSIRSKVSRPRTQIGLICLSTFNNKVFTLLEKPKSQDKPWRIPSVDSVYDILNAPNLQYLNSIHEPCNSSKKSNYEVYSLFIESDPSDLKYESNKLSWHLVGEAEGLLDDCEKQIMSETSLLL